eukprot:gene11036-biopygen3093
MKNRKKESASDCYEPICCAAPLEFDEALLLPDDAGMLETLPRDVVIGLVQKILIRFWVPACHDIWNVLFTTHPSVWILKDKVIQLVVRILVSSWVPACHGIWNAICATRPSVQAVSSPSADLSCGGEMALVVGKLRGAYAKHNFPTPQLPPSIVPPHLEWVLAPLTLTMDSYALICYQTAIGS